MLAKKPFGNTSVIIGPHMYGPTISKNRVSSKGQKLYDRMDASFGYLQQRFPLIIGEFGSYFRDRDDLEHLRDFAAYIRNRTAVTGWMFWAYNANCADTGGLVSRDWQDLNWTKLSWLIANMGL